jgi:hypothetical protein
MMKKPMHDVDVRLETWVYFLRIFAPRRQKFVDNWVDFDSRYLGVTQFAWRAVGGDLNDEPSQSVIDGFSHAMFVEGWVMALRKIGQLNGVHPIRFEELVNSILTDDGPIPHPSPADFAIAIQKLKA